MIKTWDKSVLIRKLLKYNQKLNSNFSLITIILFIKICLN